MPAPSELAAATGRILVEAAVVHAERLRCPPGDGLSTRVAAAALFHAAIRRQFRIARGPERVGVRLAAGLQPALLLRLGRASSPGRGRRARRLIATPLHDGLGAPAVLWHVRLDGGPHHVHGRSDRWHVEPAEIGHRPLPGYGAPAASQWRRQTIVVVVVIIIIAVETSTRDFDVCERCSNGGIGEKMTDETCTFVYQTD